MRGTVEAKFSGNFRKYDFINEIEGIQVGDMVVVDTVHGYQIAKVVGVYDSHVSGTKHVIQKIDDTEHKQRLERDKKKKELKRKMEARRKKLQENEIYHILAKEDQEMAELLDEFSKL